MEENEKAQAESAQNEQKNETNKEKDIRDNKLWALLSYLGVLVIIPLIMKNDSEFVQFHVKQGLILLAGWIIAWLPFGQIIGLIAFIFSVLGIINVLSGKQEKLPIVGELAEKIKI